MPDSKLNSKNFDRRKQFRRITDQFTNDLHNACTTPQCFSCLERTAEAVA
ncbi:hypothetical protein SAMN05421863_108814 [Nitrosomonas communis]|uniref:Uncharacterized protein n=1 Tax=Nitrosomonas communis TaxID=44574 RepID=A0A1I4VR17_9PROT|nr:hypothetical protein SAMN05421863_108814 [Nitrosomonas communis]